MTREVRTSIYGLPVPDSVLEMYRAAEASGDDWDWRAANIAYWACVARVQRGSHIRTDADLWQARIDATRFVDEGRAGNPGYSP